MAEVVQQSLQVWRDDDIAAMREYLQQQARTKKWPAKNKRTFDRALNVVKSAQIKCKCC